jgi:hypothetical protein
MRILIGLLLLLAAALLQTTLFARITLLQGTADIVLLVLMTWMMQEGNRPDWRWGIAAGLLVGYASALPDLLLLAGYIAAAGLCQLLHERIWQVRVLTLATSVLAGTLVLHALTLAYLWAAGSPLNLVQSLNLVTLPTVLLNLILLLPMNALISELTKLVSPNIPA